MTSETIEYSIVNREEHFPDSASAFWIDETFVDTPLFKTGSPATLKVWFWLMAHAAPEKGLTVKRSMSNAVKRIGLSREEVLRELNALSEFDVIRFSVRTDHHVADVDFI
jgi:hypothetical protein